MDAAAPEGVPRPLVVGLLLAGAGAVLLLLRLGVWVAVGGVLAAVLGTVLAAPHAERPGAILNGWWTALAVGALLSLAGTALEQATRGVGGLITVAGAVTMVVAVGLAWPSRSDDAAAPPRPSPGRH